MLVDHGTEVQARMRDRMLEAERRRLAARAGVRQAGARQAGARQAGARQALAGYRWRLREAAGFGPVRTGLRLLDARRA
jgi:hypothetical protein